MRSYESKPSPTNARGVPPICYSVEEVANAIGICRTLVFRLIRDKKITVVRIGRRTLIPVSECEAYLQRLVEEANPAGDSSSGLEVDGPPEDEG